MTKELKEQFRKLKCLKCDKLFRTTIEVRICNQCKLTYDATFDWDHEEKPYANMGVWEKKR